VYNLFLVYSLLVHLKIPACFGRLCAHHQEKQLCLCDTWYLLFCMDDWYAGCIPDNHPHRVTNTKCRIDTVISLNDGHIVARNMWRKEINILRKIMHQVCFNLQDYARMHGQRNIKKSAVLQFCVVSVRSVFQEDHWGREGSFKLFKRPFPGFLTILIL